jgi:hypothetical protein
MVAFDVQQLDILNRVAKFKNEKKIFSQSKPCNRPLVTACFRYQKISTNIISALLSQRPKS